MRYDNLDQLHTAFQVGELQGVALTLDNDSASLYDDGETVFRMHPDELLRQALDLLSIPYEAAAGGCRCGAVHPPRGAVT